MATKAVSVGTTRVQIVAVNIKRTGVVFRNRGGAEVFISRDKTNIAVQGFPIPSGGFASFLELEGDDTVNAIYALTTAGTADIRINESFEPLPISEIVKIVEARR